MAEDGREIFVGIDVGKDRRQFHLWTAPAFKGFERGIVQGRLQPCIRPFGCGRRPLALFLSVVLPDAATPWT